MLGLALLMMCLYIILFALYLQIEKNKQKMNYYKKMKKANMLTEVIGKDNGQNK